MSIDIQEFSQSKEELKNEMKNEMELRKQKDKIYSRITAQLKKSERAENIAQKEREKLNALIQEHKVLKGEIVSKNSSMEAEQK